MPNNILTVSQLNRYVKALFDENKLLGEIFIKGEISNFVCQYKSGHFYFTLKDENASIKCVMFKSFADAIRFMPDNGMSVIIRASATLYERDGSYQLNVMDMQPDGLGSLHLAYEQLKSRLEAEGLFSIEHKKPLPLYPNKIGVVTSKSGAVLQDIINVLSRRYPLANIVLAEVVVQGALAAEQIANAINNMNAKNACDVMIVGRGGGSIEDLWAFNEEITVRAVYQSNIPVISAVGHETDYTLCDFVADLRAATPSAAAELVAPSIDELKGELLWYRNKIEECLQNKLESGYNRLNDIKQNRALKSPMFFVERNRQKLDFLIQLNSKSMEQVISKKQAEIAQKAILIDSLSPLKILGRGYSITFDENDKAIKNILSLQNNDIIKTRLTDGEVLSQVIEIKRLKKGE